MMSLLASFPLMTTQHFTPAKQVSKHLVRLYHPCDPPPDWPPPAYHISGTSRLAPQSKPFFDDKTTIKDLILYINNLHQKAWVFGSFSLETRKFYSCSFFAFSYLGRDRQSILRYRPVLGTALLKNPLAASPTPAIPL